VALGQVFSEYLRFPCQSPFHRLLHNHLSSGAGTIGQTVAAVPSGLSFAPREKKRCKVMDWIRLIQDRIQKQACYENGDRPERYTIDHCRMRCKGRWARPLYIHTFITYIHTQSGEFLDNPITASFLNQTVQQEVILCR
jgi:hypothetical protein